MGGVGSLQPDAVVRPPAVVEDDEALNLLQSLPVRPETPVLTVGALALDGAVHALCDGVVRGFAVLRHRYPYAVLLQFLHVEVAAVLDPPVGVVDKPGEVTSSSLSDGHAECFEGED